MADELFQGGKGKVLGPEDIERLRVVFWPEQMDLPVETHSAIRDLVTTAVDLNRQTNRQAGVIITALAVAAESFRGALTDPLPVDGEPGPSLAELAHVKVVEGETPNFEIQYAIRDRLEALTNTQTKVTALVRQLAAQFNDNDPEFCLGDDGRGACRNCIESLADELVEALGVVLPLTEAEKDDIHWQNMEADGV